MSYDHSLESLQSCGLLLYFSFNSTELTIDASKIVDRFNRKISRAYFFQQDLISNFLKVIKKIKINYSKPIYRVMLPRLFILPQVTVSDTRYSEMITWCVHSNTYFRQKHVKFSEYCRVRHLNTYPEICSRFRVI